MYLCISVNIPRNIKERKNNRVDLEDDGICFELLCVRYISTYIHVSGSRINRPVIHVILKTR